MVVGHSHTRAVNPVPAPRVHLSGLPEFQLFPGKNLRFSHSPPNRPVPIAASVQRYGWVRTCCFTFLLICSGLTRRPISSRVSPILCSVASTSASTSSEEGLGAG